MSLQAIAVTDLLASNNKTPTSKALGTPNQIPLKDEKCASCALGIIKSCLSTLPASKKNEERRVSFSATPKDSENDEGPADPLPESGAASPHFRLPTKEEEILDAKLRAFDARAIAKWDCAIGTWDTRDSTIEQIERLKTMPENTKIQASLKSRMVAKDEENYKYVFRIIPHYDPYDRTILVDVEVQDGHFAENVLRTAQEKMAMIKKWEGVHREK